MDLLILLQVLTLLFGFYMAWNIGANDVANAMGTSVGSKALTLKKAVLLAAVLEFSGAYFVGSSVSETIQGGIVEPSIFENDPMIFVLGMMGSLFATGALLQLASYLGLPISTTHAIVGAILGFGLCIGGVQAIYWNELSWIVSSWILSPLLSGIISYLIFLLIQRKILYALDPIAATHRLSPFFVCLCTSVASLSIVYHGLHLEISLMSSLLISLSIGLFFFFLSRPLITRIQRPVLQMSGGFAPQQMISLEKAMRHLQRVQISNQNPSYTQQVSSLVDQIQTLCHTVQKANSNIYSTNHYHGVEKIFVVLQILSASLVAFAHGANDVANAIGPVAAVFSTLQSKTLGPTSSIPSWLLLLGGAGIVIGLATWGWRVIETIGKKITELTPTRGFSAEFGAAVTILLASKLGLPISTTHALIGAVLGVGMARGIKALNLQTIKEIVISWAVTIPLCALLSILFFYILKSIFY